ncbi:MAG: hypothetical protein ACFFD2_02260 [Promethearchaeota archaeon]
MKETVSFLGIISQPLRNWSKKGYIEAIVGKNRHRCFQWSEIKRLMPLADPQSNAKNYMIYYRVSTTIQRDNLKR